MRPAENITQPTWPVVLCRFPTPALTLSMILLGRIDSSLPPNQFVKADVYRKSWHLEHIWANRLGERWIKKYIRTLQIRQKWLTAERSFRVETWFYLWTRILNGKTPKGLIVYFAKLPRLCNFGGWCVMPQ